MKTIPAHFELNQDDIKEAIAYWMHNKIGTAKSIPFKIIFKCNEMGGNITALVEEYE